MLSFGILLLSLACLINAQSTNTQCRVPADPDTLGLGVRLGLYFQTISNIIISVVRHEEVEDSFLTTIFFFTSFIAAVIFSVAFNNFAPGAIIACTWYPLLLASGLFYFEFRGKGDPKVWSRSMLPLCIFLSSLCVNIWFWFKGVNVEHPDQCMEPRVFLFANLPARGNVKILFAIVSVLMIVALLAIFVLSFLYVLFSLIYSTSHALSGTVPEGQSVEAQLHHRHSMPVNVNPALKPTLPSRNVSKTWPLNEPKPMSTEADFITELRVPITPQQHEHANQTVEQPTAPNQLADYGTDISEAVAGFYILIIYITASELQLKWNHLDGIYTISSTGQIIPLGFGVLALVRSIWLLRYVDKDKLRSWWKDIMDEPFKNLVLIILGTGPGRNGGLRKTLKMLRDREFS